MVPCFLTWSFFVSFCLHLSLLDGAVFPFCPFHSATYFTGWSCVFCSPLGISCFPQRLGDYLALWLLFVGLLSVLWLFYRSILRSCVYPCCTLAVFFLPFPFQLDFLGLPRWAQMCPGLVMLPSYLFSVFLFFSGSEPAPLSVTKDPWQNVDLLQECPVPAVERGPQEQGTTATLTIPECFSFLGFWPGTPHHRCDSPWACLRSPYQSVRCRLLDAVRHTILCFLFLTIFFLLQATLSYLQKSKS